MLKQMLTGRLVKAWYRPHDTLASCLRPLAYLYGRILPLRKRYLTKQQTRFPVPVVVVGNLTVGGTGKTPLVIYLASLLQAAGYHPGIVSRGYKGTASGQFPVHVKDQHSADTVGDEPFMIYKRTRLPVFICPDRVKAIGALLTVFPQTNIVIADDGLQHYRMGRDVEIAVIDGQRRFGNARLLPAGPLREPMSRLDTLDFVVGHGQAGEHEYLMTLSGAQLYSVNHQSTSHPVQYFEQETVHAVAGIGHPERFFDALRQQGLKVIPHAFHDHHQYTKACFQFEKKAPIIMTEKDAVKCFHLGLKNAWYLPVQAELSDTFSNDFLRKINHG